MGGPEDGMDFGEDHSYMVNVAIAQLPILDLATIACLFPTVWVGYDTQTPEDWAGQQNEFRYASTTKKRILNRLETLKRQRSLLESPNQVKQFKPLFEAYSEQLTKQLQIGKKDRSEALAQIKGRMLKDKLHFLHETGFDTHLGIVGLLIHHEKYEAVAYLVRRSVVPDRCILADNSDAWSRIDAHREALGQRDTRGSYNPLRLTSQWSKKEKKPDSNKILEEVKFWLKEVGHTAEDVTGFWLWNLF